MSPAAIAFWLLLAGAPSGTSPLPAPGPGPDEVGQAAEAEGVRYPLGTRGVPDFLAPGEPFKLVDLRYGFSDTNTTTHDFGARLKVRDWGYLAAETHGERRALSVSNQRLFLGVSSDQGNWGAAGEYRARRFLIGADALQHDDNDDSGWRLGSTLALRLSPDVELLGDVRGDTARPDDRFLRTASAGILWQWRAALEAFGGFRREYVATDAGAENEVDSWTIGLVAQIGAAEISTDGVSRDTEGRFPRHEMEGTLRARVSALPRLLLEGEAGGSWRDASTQTHVYRGAATWFARRFTLPRAGEAAKRELALARAATAAGYNERRVFDDDALRAQRERLALSSRRHEMRSDFEGVYRSQVEERSVPVLGVEIEDRADALSGSTERSIGFFLGVPWPPALPWRANDAATPFLNLAYERIRHTSAQNFRANTDRLTLVVSLDREIDLVIGWQHAESTALDLIRGIGARNTFEGSIVYAFGR